MSDGRHCLRCARNAWQKLGNMSPEEAMEQYLAILSDKVPGWMEDHPHSVSHFFSETLSDYNFIGDFLHALTFLRCGFTQRDAKSQPHDVAKPDALASEGTCSSQQTNTPQRWFTKADQFLYSG